MSRQLIEAEYRGISWLEDFPIEQYDPDASRPFSIELALLIGPKGLPGEEIFLVDVSNILYLAEQMDDHESRLLVSTIVVRRFSIDAVEELIRDFCKTCRGRTWHDVALRLMRLGRWEYEGMVD